ncbi:phosphatidylserine decarboxylase [Vittaforma corneae ATCC 50505]|uniref:Phosphatidylserine decarboxylase n=1 Tax=Vittaforma corneae (strain ATCC 50505) TaxID=993615 RepID=L2GN72_VITCO|nr:phosphatidylserine decarboxylase [Vittaforma corneae ATCC 50505]ELA41757.1 phosphatidylserine decarboxylase [Vittaforma corneae ATCC 50505]
MNLFVIDSKVSHCQIKIVSLEFNSKVRIATFPETVLLDESLTSVTCIVASKSSICQIVDIDLVNGRIVPHNNVQRQDDINALLDFIDSKLAPSLLKKLHILFKKSNMLKKFILEMVRRMYFKRISSLYSRNTFNSHTFEISTEYFELKQVSVWPSVNRSMIKTSEYFNLILKRSFINKLLAYITPLGGSVYVKELNTHKIIKEYIPVSQKLILNLLYRSGVYRSFIASKIMRYLTVVAGQRFDSHTSVRSIKKFIRMYKIDINECEKREFTSFNDFFSRKLKPNARFVEVSGKVSSPADCRLLGNADGKLLGIKGKFFKVEELLERHVAFENICICRLAPQDYHRFHAPLSCEVVSIYHIQGSYHSVNPINKFNRVLDENARSVIVLKTGRGTIYYVAVGATLVGSIVLSVKAGDHLDQMDEIGYFKFGGSCVVLITDFKWELKEEISGNSLSGIETLVRVGDSLEKC